MSAPTILQHGPTDGAAILDEAIADEARRKTFKSDQIRVSGIGHCARHQLAQAMGMVANEISWDYSEGGHLMEEPVERRLRAIYPQTEAQVSIPTTARGTWTHPDHLVPELGLALQQKTVKRRAILEYLDGVRDETFGLPKGYQVDPVLLEWWCWRRAGFCLTQDRRRLNIVPQRYELLYLGRDDFGESRVSIPVAWDAARAQALADEFSRRVDLLAWGELPDKTYPEPQFDCGFVRKWYDWDGAYDQRDSHCPLFEKCWGRPYEPKYAPSFRTPKKGWSRIQ